MANTRPTRYFGITTDLSGNLGTGLIANSIQYSHTVDVAEARDEKGKLLDLAPYSQNEEITVDGSTSEAASASAQSSRLARRTT